MSETFSESRIDQLIADYVDGTISQDDLPVLADWLARSPLNVKRVAQISMTQFCLTEVTIDTRPEHLLAFLRELEDAAEPVCPGDLSASHSISSGQSGVLSRQAVSAVIRSPWIYGAIAAVLALSLVLVIAFQGGPASNQELAQQPTPMPASSSPVATLTGQQDARWSADPPSVGDAIMPRRRLVLLEGFAQITTQHNTQVILEAPCSVEFTDNPNALRLHQGKLVGLCRTQASKGFVVLTDDGTVTDIGTEFGVSHATHTCVTVFVGEVSVTPVPDRAAPSRPVNLQAGSSAQIGPDATVEMIAGPDVADRFVRNWTSVAHIPQIQGDIRYESSLPVSLAHNAYESQDIRLFLEQAGLVTNQAIRVSLTEPGRYDNFPDNGQTLADSTPIDCYLLHFDMTRDRSATTPRRATIRFDRPIIGVIAHDAGLVTSDELFGVAGVDYGDYEASSLRGRGLEPKLSLPGDSIELSEDRRSLTIELHGNFAIDQLRVLVQSAGDANNPTTP